MSLMSNTVPGKNSAPGKNAELKSYSPFTLSPWVSNRRNLLRSASNNQESPEREKEGKERGDGHQESSKRLHTDSKWK